jgi:hypothetical protein
MDVDGVGGRLDSVVRFLPSPTRGRDGTRMTHKHEWKALATAALLLVAGAGCSGDRDDTPSSAPSTPVPSTPSSSAPPTQSELAGQRADALVREYFNVLDALRQQSSRPLRLLSTVATSTQLSAQKKLVQRERSEGLRQVGDTKVGDLSVQAVNLDNSDPAAGRVPTVTVDVCWDVSHADLVDESGRSVVSSSRPSRGWTRYTVANYHWSNNPDAGWRIATSQDLKKPPCASA